MPYTVQLLSLNDVQTLFATVGYDSVISHIRQMGNGYELTKPVEEISPLPSYQYAVAVALMALGNTKRAKEICPDLWKFLGREGQTDVSYLLSRVLSGMYKAR